MFGGLDIKGSDAKKVPEPAKAPSPAASSGFSFLNAAPGPASPPAPAANSGFSFLTAVPAAATATPAPAMSGFSFLQEPTATTDSPAKTDGEPPAESSGSAFGFMAPTPQAKPEENPAESADPSASVSTGFSFLSSAPAPAPALPAGIGEPEASATTISPMQPTASSSTNISSAFAPTATPTTKSFAPAGAGISFGGASMSAARPKKKKSRAMKVGVGASTGGGSPPRSGTSSLLAPSELPKPAEETAPNSSNTREDALDAARRAEEFMNQKMQEQTVLEMTAAMEAEKAEGAAAGTTTADKPLSAAKAGGLYDDEMIAAAAAAAVEAQAMNQKGASGGARGIMGGLFRRSSPPTSSSNLNVGGGSGAGSFSSTSGTRPPKPVETTVTKPSSGNSLNSDGSADASSYTPAPAPALTSGQVQQAPMTSALSFTPALPPPASAPVPPKPKTPTEKVKALVQNFREDVETSMGKVTQLRQQRSRLLEERNRAMTQERLATQQRDLAEQQQTAAAEAEDFELADQLGGVLSSYEKEQQECAGMLQHIGLAIRELDSQKQSVVVEVQKCFQSIQAQLQIFESAEETKEHKEDDSFSKKFASMTKHLAAEHERLQNDLKHLERDEELVAEERKEVEGQISEQSCDFEEQRDEAKEKLSSLDEEIEELRKQLQAKQIDATQLRNEIAGHDDSILQVRVQFSRQLQRVQKKESTTQDHRSEWETEKAKFQSGKDQHEAEVKAHSEDQEAHEELMASLKEDITMACILEEIVEEEVGEVDTTSEDNGKDEGADTDLLGLQADVVKCEVAVTEAREILKAATNTLESLETEMGALISKIPELEATKKAAAAKRDFKAAGKASKEIKDATARVKECQEELTGEAVQRKEAAENKLKKLDEELKEKRKVALEKEKETGIASMKKLAERIQHLVQTKKKVCGEDYKVDSILGVGAYVLEEQIKSLTLEGKAYGEKYGGWERLIADILPIEATVAEKPADEAESETQEPEEPAKIEEKTEVTAKGTEAVKPEAPKKEMIASFRHLTQQLQDIEVKIESAVEEEDFDLAAQLDEKLKLLLAEVEALNLTDAEMEQAVIGDDSGASETPEADAKAVNGSEAVDAAIAESKPAEGESRPTTAPDDEQDLEKTRSIDSATEVTPKAAGHDIEANESVDGKKDADSSPVEDGFVAVTDGDL